MVMNHREMIHACTTRVHNKDGLHPRVRERSAHVVQLLSN